MLCKEGSLQTFERGIIAAKRNAKQETHRFDDRPLRKKMRCWHKSQRYGSPLRGPVVGEINVGEVEGGGGGAAEEDEGALDVGAEDIEGASDAGLACGGESIGVGAAE